MMNTDRKAVEYGKIATNNFMAAIKAQGLDQNALLIPSGILRHLYQNIGISVINPLVTIVLFLKHLAHFVEFFL